MRKRTPRRKRLNKPFRKLSQFAVTLLDKVFSERDVQRWVEDFYTNFLRTHWILPNVGGGKFQQTTKNGKRS